MEQENKLETTEVDNQLDEEKREHKEDDHHSHHEHGHHSHHSHHEHEHHSHHSHHSSRDNKHHSSRREKSKDNKKPFIVKFKAWLDKKPSQRSVMAMYLSSFLLVLILIGAIYALDIRRDDMPDGPQNDSSYGENQQNPENPNYIYQSTEITVPSYWEDMIDEKTKAVKALQEAGGKDCISFVWASDTHIPDNSTARTDDLGKLMAKMMNNCDIPFAVLTGDIGTRASFSKEEDLIAAQAMIPEHLAPLWGTERLLVALGNHDGCYGDESGYYRKQFTPERLWDLYFRNQALDSRRVFSDDGTYFYVDNQAQKIRFIILNSQFGGEYLQDSNGWAVNNRFEISCYGQEQLDWLADVALDMPEGYGAIITSHVPPNISYTVDKEQLIGIINAYCEKTTYNGSHTVGVDGWTNNTVSVDFTDAKGEIITMFTGHIHQDKIDTETLLCPLVTIISSGAQVNDGEVPDRPFNTDQETSFDIVSINRKTRTIYCTRVGAGEDRVIKY